MPTTLTLIGQASGSSGLTGSLTTTASVPAGDTTWAKVINNASSPTFGSVSDPNGTYSADSNNLASANTVWARLIQPAGLASGATVNYALSAGTGTTVWLFELYTAPGGWVPDGTVPSWLSVTSQNTTPLSCTVPTTGDLVIGIADIFSSGTFTASIDAATPGWTLVDNYAVSPRSTVTAYQAGVASGTANLTFDWTGTHSQSGVLIPYAPTSPSLSIPRPDVVSIAQAVNRASTW